MLADSVYYFERNTGLITSYILQSHEGADLPNFPAIYQRTPHNKYASFEGLRGKKYLNFREMCNRLNPVQKEKWEYCISFPNGLNTIGLNFPNGTRRASSDNRCMQGRNDCFLVEFSHDWNQLTIYIFFGKGNDCAQLLRAWNSGQSIEVKE